MAETTYDVGIIGAGPAGIQAAIHAARRKIRGYLQPKIRGARAFMERNEET